VKHKLAELLIIGLAIALPVAVSTYIHHPDAYVPMYGLKYSDIVYGLYYPIFNPSENRVLDRWFNLSDFNRFKYGGLSCPIPYVHYKFEYPPIVGVLWYISTCTGFSLSKSLDEAVRIHYLVQAITLSAFHALLILSLYALIRSRSNGGASRLLLFLLPSTLIYLIYNWDVIAAAFAVIGILCALKSRWFYSGLFQGLSISSKFLTLGVSYYYVVKLVTLHERRDLLKFIVGLFIGAAVPMITLLLVSPVGFNKLISHHAGWYCENCIYLLIVRDIWSDLHRRLFFSIAALLALAYPLLANPWRGIEFDVESKYLFAGVSSLILFNYVFSPQMLLLITPLAILALDERQLLVYAMVDVFNALIILTFFEFEKPHEFGSVPQYMASARNLLLLIIFISVVVSIMRRKLESLERGDKS
jgi:hypothetical protein